MLELVTNGVTWVVSNPFGSTLVGKELLSGSIVLALGVFLLHSKECFLVFLPIRVALDSSGDGSCGTLVSSAGPSACLEELVEV